MPASVPNALDANARLEAFNDGVSVGKRRGINAIGGGFVDNPGAERLDYTPPAAAGGVGMFTTVKTTTAPGVTSIILNPAPGVLSNLARCVLLFGVGKTTWDLRLISPGNVSGNTITVAALDNGHPAGETVAVLPVPMCPFTWLGGDPANTNAAATSNVAIMNRLLGHTGVQSVIGGFALQLDVGFYVNDMVTMQGGSTRLTGVTGQNSGCGLFARSGFPFDALGSKQILAVCDQVGNICTLKDGYLADITTWIDNIFLSGNSLSDSVGLVHSPQQPGSAPNLRLYEFMNTALAFGGQNYWDMQNLQLNNCHIGLNCSHIIASIRNHNITSPTTVGGTQYGMILGGFNILLSGGDPETILEPGPMYALYGGSNYTLDSLWTSGRAAGTSPAVMIDVNSTGFDGYCTYDIRNFICNDQSTSLKFLRDVQRGFSIQANPSDIPSRTLWAWAAGSAARYRNASLVDTAAGGGSPHAA